MIDAKIKPEPGGFIQKRPMMSAKQKSERRGLKRFGSFVRRTARSTLRKRKKISAPGEPPAMHEGLPRKLLVFVYDPKSHSVVIGPAKINKPGKALQLLEHGGEAPAPEPKEPGRMSARREFLTYRPRPFMAPAFEKELPNAARAFAGTFKK